MCDFCKSNRRVIEIEEPESVVMRLVGNEINLDYDAYSCDSSFKDSFKINFCPYCGENIKERAGD